MSGDEARAAAKLCAGRGTGLGERRARLLGSSEELRPPRQLLPASEQSRAARSRSRSAAPRREPLRLCPREGGAAGGAAPPARRGAGGRACAPLAALPAPGEG